MHDMAGVGPLLGGGEGLPEVEGQGVQQDIIPDMGTAGTSPGSFWGMGHWLK